MIVNTGAPSLAHSPKKLCKEFRKNKNMLHGLKRKPRKRFQTAEENRVLSRQRNGRRQIEYIVNSWNRPDGK